MCDVYFDDGEPTAAYSESRIKAARKNHVCDCCHGAIRKSESYTRHFWICDKSPNDEKICDPCSEVLERFAYEHDGYRHAPSFFAEALESCIAEGDEESERWRADLDAIKAREAARKQEAA